MATGDAERKWNLSILTPFRYPTVPRFDALTDFQRQMALALAILVMRPRGAYVQVRASFEVR